jgi:quercetin dioxygenase-like cupin family protein
MATPVRRIIAGVDDSGKASVLGDAPSPDVSFDPARPGFSATRIWVTEATPAKVKGIRDTLHLPHALEPPAGGTILWCFEFPPEASYIGKILPAHPQAYFASMGSPGISTARNGAPHPYMQRTRTIDFCHIIDGEITLVLDKEEVHLKEGDALVQRGTSHAWSNRSERPCRVLISQHAATGDYKASASPPLRTQQTSDRSTMKLRRIVTGHDREGRSCVTHDSDTPVQLARPSGSTFFELWTIENMPAPLDSAADFGTVERALRISPPALGAHWRVTKSPAREFDPKALNAEDKKRHQAAQTNDGAERRANARHWGMHRTPTVDYAIGLQGKRILILEDEDVVIGKGDVVIQLGNWHSWGTVPDMAGQTSFIMIGGELG